MAEAQAALLERDLPNWLPILYGLTAMFGDDPDDLEKIDIWDENLWYLCNPSLGKHLRIRNIRMEAKDAHRACDICWNIREAQAHAYECGYRTFDIPHPTGEWEPTPLA